MTEPITATAVAESPKEAVIETKDLTSADLEKKIVLLKAEKEKSEEKKNEVEVEPEVKVEVKTVPVEPIKVAPPVPVETFQYRQPVAETPKQTQPVVQQPDPVSEFKAWAQENMQVDPVGTVIAINKIINRPAAETERKNQLMTETMKLTTSEDTRDAFANPVIRAEMEKVIQTDPNRWMDELGWVKPEYMRDVFYIAKGRVGQAPQIKNIVEQPVPVEGKNKVTTPQTPDYKSMSSEELEAHIKSRIK